MSNASYPPSHHLSIDREKAFHVIEQCPFATLVSQGDDDVFVTQLPLMLNQSKSGEDYLIGHMDKNNPQVHYLDGRQVTVLFHGPDAYISPRVYLSQQLPTWNYIAVHVKGKVSLINEQKLVAASIIDMTVRMEGEHPAFVLSPNEPSFQALLPHVIGFRIKISEVYGRFKLSQDKSEGDKQQAKEHLKQQSKLGFDCLIDKLV